MSGNRQINSALLLQVDSAINTVINATPTGSTDTAVLRFNAAATIVGTALSEATTAAAGTIVTLGETGMFSVELTLGFTGAVAVAAGIGFGMAAAPIVADPVVGTDGVIKAADMLMVASSTQVIDLGTVVNVSSAAVAAGTATLRFLATNSGGAAPVGVVAASVNYRILKVANTAF
jgi:hypothetical protein